MQLRKTAGHFDVETSKGKWSRRFFGPNGNPWSANFGFPFELESEHRHANAGVRFGKTRAYVAVDEDASGNPVVETWVIRNLTFAPGHAANPLVRVKVTSRSTATGKPPSKRLKKRRAKTAAQPMPGVWANPAPTADSQRERTNAAGQRTKAPSRRLVKRRRVTNKAPEGFYANPRAPKNPDREFNQVWIAKDGKPTQYLGMFQAKSHALEYGKAYAATHGVQIALIKLK